MIRFACKCGRQLQAAADQVGTRAACPVCSRVVTVPDEAEAARPADPWYAAVPAPPVAPPAGCESPARAPKAAAEKPPVVQELSGKAVISLLLAFPSVFFLWTIDSRTPLSVRYAFTFGDAVVVTLAAAALWEIA